MAAELHGLLATDCDVVDVVPDGRALIEAVGRTLPGVIVCDIGMPVVNGLAAAVAILATRPDARIVFVTVEDNRSVIRRALKLGARGYVLKRDAGNELVAAVHTAHEGGIYLSASTRDVLGHAGGSGFNE